MHKWYWATEEEQYTEQKGNRRFVLVGTGMAKISQQWYTTQKYWFLSSRRWLYNFQGMEI